ncbi:MAG: putative monocarboxylate transporter mch1 [Alyxoria varia]|nr:MAG: putative monocarboxylate transporter mch1 [Alyxoria varia]
MPTDRTHSIGRLEFRSHEEQAPLLRGGVAHGHSRQASRDTIRSSHFFEDVAGGIQEKERKRMLREIRRYVSFFWAIGKVNTVSIVSEVATYLPVSLFGLLVDRRGPRLPTLLAGCFFGFGYILAAFSYRRGPPPEVGGDGWPFFVMVIAFIGIGMGTSCMYLSAVTTCAKNFGKGKYRGFALAAPIACFGLSGMWQSQLGSNLLYERNPDGSKGEVDVFRYFLFLGGLLLGVGLVGSILLQIVGEDELIDEAVEDLERSGYLETDDFLRSGAAQSNYGTIDSDSQRPSTSEREAKKQAEQKKQWLLNEETRRYIGDHTMWWLTLGFFLVSGPGEAFINNLGTIIGTLYPPASSTTGGSSHGPAYPTTSPATHVSIVAVSSTVARILAGTLSDVFGPRSEPWTRRSAESLSSSVASLDPLPPGPSESGGIRKRLSFSRMHLLLGSTLILALGQILLASGVVQDHAATRFWVVSSFVGIGYGAAFSLVPIVISCVWGVENFGTNWGITAMVPAAGAAMWGAIYAAVYERGNRLSGGDPERCYGYSCYETTFWGMAVASVVACCLWVWAWMGPRGWTKRGVAV